MLRLEFKLDPREMALLAYPDDFCVSVYTTRVPLLSRLYCSRVPVNNSGDPPGPPPRVPVYSRGRTQERTWSSRACAMCASRS